MNNNTELRKRRISDYFASQQKIETVKVKKKRLSFGETPDIKCPKMKLFGEVDENFSINEKNASNRQRSTRRIITDKTQSLLDFGQRNFGNIVCKKCELVYCVDDEEDRNRHEIYHNRLSGCDQFKITKAIRNNLEKNAHKMINGHEIVHIGRSPTNIIKKVIDNWMTFIDEEIGYYAKNSIWDDNKRLFIAIGKNKSIGLFLSGVLVIEKLNEAIFEKSEQKVIQTNDDDWIVGVDRIWTHSGARLKGIAKSLLDAATIHDRQFEYRKRRLRVAFSELTKDGKQFALKYIKTSYPNGNDHNLLIY